MADKRFVVRSETKWWIEEQTGSVYNRVAVKLPFRVHCEEEGITLANSLQDAFDKGVASIPLPPKD